MKMTKRRYDEKVKLMLPYFIVAADALKGKRSRCVCKYLNGGQFILQELAWPGCILLHFHILLTVHFLAELACGPRYFALNLRCNRCWLVACSARRSQA